MRFCKALYLNNILGHKVKRSADEFRKEHPNKDYSKRYWVYKMAKSIHYQFDSKWLLSNKHHKLLLKLNNERKKFEKYMPIKKRHKKEFLRSTPNNYEIDNVIGKCENKQTLLTLIYIHTENFYSEFYKIDMFSSKETLKEIIQTNNLIIKTLTMDNGGENNLLHKIINREKTFNCHPYSFSEKGILENKHWILKMTKHALY